MIKAEGINVPFQYDHAEVRAAICRGLKLRKTDLGSVEILREAVDARKKPRLRKVLTCAVEVFADENKVLKNAAVKASAYVPRVYEPLREGCELPHPPVVVGAGPAGLFGGLVLALAGLKPVIVEAGQPCQRRKEEILSFCGGGELLPFSNIQFGGGGAGMFSDGKLNTGTRDIRHRWIIETMVRCGAPAEIARLAKPHIGSDILPAMSSSLQHEIEAAGGTFLFDTRFTGIRTEKNCLAAVVLESGGKTREIPCERLLLASGHSARNTVKMLCESGVSMEQKPFSVGARIEHLQRDINLAQYGAEYPGLAADYKLSAHLSNGRSVYTFCMCPGGTVVPAASESSSVVTNGMSEWARSEANANSALLVSVVPGDYPSDHPLAGIEFQRELEQRAFALGGGNYFAPAQLIGDFMIGRPSKAFGRVKPSYRPGVTLTDLSKLFPSYVTESLREALPLLNRKLKGFSSEEAVLTAPETRSSAPYRILREENGCCSIEGIYPAGEGSGYAGGIMSSAADGMKAAEKIAVSR